MTIILGHVGKSPGQRPMADCSEHGNEFFGSIKEREYVYLLKTLHYGVNLGRMEREKEQK
jgi:hypothetical protein